MVVGDHGLFFCYFFFFSSRRRHTRLQGDWSSDVCSSDLAALRRRRAGPRASLRFARTTPASRAPRERTEDQLVPMGPRDIPTPPIVRVAEGIRGVFGE